VTAAVQPDLFGELDQAEQERLERIAEREAWRARFTFTTISYPYDTVGGPAGTVFAGAVQCPACRKVEANDFLLSINHGYDPGVPGHAPWGVAFGQTCSRLDKPAGRYRSGVCGCGHSKPEHSPKTRLRACERCDCPSFAD
jgi:hypothetical protein